MTKDILHVFRHEWSGFVRSGALFTLAAIVGVVGVATAIAEHRAWTWEQGVREQLQAQEIAQWLALGDTHIHKAAHRGYFVVRDMPPGVILDRGVWDFGGSAIWLEAHRRNAPQLRAADDAGVIARAAPRGVGPSLLWLTPLLLAVLFHGIVASERARGSLAFAVSSGASASAIVLGKTLALAAAACIATASPLLIAAALAINGGLGVVAGLVWMLTVLAAVATFAGLVVVVSSLSRRPLGALVCLLLLWFAMAVMWPRLTPGLANQFAPIPSSQTVRSQAEVAAEGLVSDETEKEMIAQLKTAGVETPNPSGVSAMAAEVDAARKFAEIFAPFEKGMKRQAALLDVLSWGSPLAAADRTGDALVNLGDRDQFDFEAGAETMRIATQMTLNEGWARAPESARGAPDLWRNVVNSARAEPHARQKSGAASFGLMIWAVISGGGLLLAARSVRRSI